jgi:conjugative transposon TraM protein
MEKEKEVESKAIRQKKMLMVLPVLFVPFLTLGFYALGGGRGTTAAEASQRTTNVNREVPGATIDSGKMDKLAYYEAVAKAQDERTRQLKKEQESAFDFTSQSGPAKDQEYAFGHDSKSPEASEKKVYAQLEKLNRELERSAASTEFPNRKMVEDLPGKVTNMEEVERLERLIRSEGAGPKEEDPEMKEINTMLEKIMDIQHPTRVQERLKEKSILEPQAVFPVSGSSEALEIITLNNPLKDTALKIGGFFGLENDTEQAEVSKLVARAVVHETLTLQTGDDLRLRLLDDIFVNGIKIPAGEFLTGKITVDGQRPTVSIETITYQYGIYPVKLQVYDVDGMPGLKIHGSINKDAVREGADNALRNMQLMSLDQSMGTQVASAGIEAAKGLFSKKLKAAKVTVKAGHQVLLVSGN